MKLRRNGICKMTIQDFSIKIDLRLNKGASHDFDNIWSEVKEEAANKAVLDFTRRQYRGKNQTQEGAEETTARVDDLQVLLKKEILSVKDKGVYAETEKLPTDYLYFKRLTPIVSKNACSNIEITSYLEEEANVDILIHPVPSFEFEETFHTIIGNRIHVYHQDEFVVNKTILTYYRKPKKLDFTKPSQILEFKDDVCEMLVDEAVKIIASDIESINQKQLAQERVETNN